MKTAASEKKEIPPIDTGHRMAAENAARIDTDAMIVTTRLQRG